MDQSLFGTSAAPPYDPKPTDESPAHTERINQTMGWVLTTDSLPDLLEDQRMVDDLVANRPDFASLSNQEIIAWARSHMTQFRHLFAQHIFTSYCSTVPLGIIQGVTAAIGDPSLAMRLVAGIGGVDSAAPSWSLWDLSREVRSNAALTAAFDAGVPGIEARIADDPEAATFRKAFDQFLDAFGSRGPNEWEMRAPTWGTHPELALTAVDRMRRAPDASNPQRHFDERHADREALTQQVGEALVADPTTQGQFLAACRASQIFLAGRERSKTTIIKFVHEARLGMHALGQRMVDAGHFDEVEDFGMITDEEYDAFLADPASFRDTVTERKALHARLQTLEPPFIVNGTVPPIEEWVERGSSPVDVARPGEVLAGISGCPGTYTGRAVVILRADDQRSFEPGDVLVAPITDPAWTPLFVSAGAVIVDVGAQISHAVIVSRELGIPCVVSVTDGTRRIPDGALVTVDGTNGTVTVH
jgi:pyruvate,water dikinase